MPFRFGSVTMTSLSVIYLQVRFDLEDGRRIEGVGSSVLSPMWFDKTPELSYADKEHNLLVATSLAAHAALEAGVDHAYGLHQSVQPAVRHQCEERGIPGLVSSFGVALLDSAVIDGLCRASGSSFHAGLRDDLFGFGPVPWLPAEPRVSIRLRHTVGLVDPLVAADVETPLHDGLPETLEEVVRAYGVDHFKIKIGDDASANLERLRRIAAVLRCEAGADYRAVFDGNEQFTSMAEFVAFATAFAEDSRLRELWQRTLWFEQPVERDAALDPAVARDLTRIAKPVILDESDATDDTVSAALQLGYGGVSAKNCKGVFRTLHSRRVIAQWSSEHDRPAILAAEDLTHPGLHALQQDTAVIAALGIDHAERNGHHYVRGLDFLSQSEREFALREYPSLYELGEDGLTRLSIRDGCLQVGEIVGNGYGGSPELDFDHLEPLPLPDPNEDR